MLADEDAVFEAYGFKAAEEAATAAGPEEVPIPSIPTEIQQEWKTQRSRYPKYPKYPNRDPKYPK